VSGPVDDAAARRSIRCDLGTTQFVEAGAGTGKTTALVARIVELVATGTARLDQVAAITFTEAAAGELRDRVGVSLEQLADGRYHDEFAPVPGPPVGGAGQVAGDRAELARAALAELDGAAVSTLHGFARRILAEHPFEAGLPPAFEVFDEIRSQVAFGERWAAFLDELLEDAVAGPAVLRLLVCGVTLDQLREVAEELNENWDLVAEHRPPDVEPPAPVEVGPVVRALREAEGLSRHCTAEDDRLLVHIGRLGGLAARLEATADELDALQLLADAPRLAFGQGRRDNWSCPIDEVRDALARAHAARADVVERAGRAALSRYLSAATGLTLDAAEGRRGEGRLEFHDLLVLARDLVRRSPEVSHSLGSQYRFLLIDEFQDTDPIQAELAVRIASDDPGAGEKDWRALGVEPGRLFFVGDPLQSIYRFRRADISLFLEVRDRLGPGTLHLTGNRRSVPGLIGWVNQVFTGLIGDGEPAMQPAYRPLAPHRGEPGPGAPQHPVVVLGQATEGEELIDQIREREAAEIAGTIERATREGWAVGDEGRAATLADITILVPTRTSLPILQRALDDAAIPYRLESTSLVYAATEVRDLLTVLRAIDDPTDEVAILAALRSPLFGCGDDDLYAFHRAGGRWDYRSPPPVALGPDHPVVDGQRSLAELHQVRWWHDVSALIEKVLADRRQLELALDGPRPRESWRRLRFVADQARQFTDAFGGDLRRYLAWADLQCEEGARVTESVLPEVDDDSVRIMTIHASKGLEFPIVVMTGLNTAADGRGGRRVLWGDGVPRWRSPRPCAAPATRRGPGGRRRWRSTSGCASSTWRPPGPETTWSSACTTRRGPPAPPPGWRRPPPPTRPPGAVPAPRHRSPLVRGARSRPPVPIPTTPRSPGCGGRPTGRSVWPRPNGPARWPPPPWPGSSTSRRLSRRRTRAGWRRTARGGAGTARPGVVAGPGPRWAGRCTPPSNWPTSVVTRA